MKNKQGAGKRPIVVFAIMTVCAVLTLGGCVPGGSPVSPGSDDVAETGSGLPDAYYIEVSVVSSSGFGSQETTYALSQSDGWIYIKLGYEREQYVYRQISEGKYIEYKYSTEKGQYLPTMIFDPLQAQIDAGNVPLDSVAVGQESVDAKFKTLDPYIFAYKTLTPALSYTGDEEAEGVKCKKYTGTVNAFLTKSELEFLIDPVTGLAFRYINKTKTLFMTTRQRSEITVYSKTPRIPSIA